MDVKVINLSASLASVKVNLHSDKVNLHSDKVNLHSDKVVKHIQAQLADPIVRAKILASQTLYASELASETIRICRSFDDAEQQLQQLQNQSEPWVSNWVRIRRDYIDMTKKALAVEKMGDGYFSDFSKNTNNIDWAEQNWQAAKDQISKFLSNPVGSELETESSNVSQGYTNNRRMVSAYKDEFFNFVSEMSKQCDEAQAKLHNDMDALSAEIAKYQSTAAQIERALRQIAGIPSWMTWLISEILDALGIASAEKARRMLDQNYADQQRLREKQDAVRRESERVVQLGAALVRSKNILVVLTTDVADIDSRLDQFASQWAQHHHDIVSISADMAAAGDSATKRSLISRLKLLGSSVDALLSAMKSYVQMVGGSGLFN